MSGVIKIHGLINGEPTAFDGQYVVEYDAGRNGYDPLSGREMFAYLVTTPIRAEATRFEDPLEVWRRIDPRMPTRADGRPNRPLTAFTIEVESGD